MAKGLWRRVGNVAVPCDARSLGFLQARKEGVPFVADTNGARNAKQLSLWWLLCQLVCEAEDLPSDVKVSDDLKVSLGHADTYVHRDGSVYVKPRSIAFESMTQEDFNALFQGAVRVIAGWLGNAPSDVQARFDSMVADKRYAEYMR